MTEREQKAIKWMKNVRDDAVVTLDYIAKEEPNVSPMLYAGRKEKAETIINGFEELEKYRAIGTVEDIQQKLAELERWHTTEVNPKIKNVFANTSTQICHNCDHKDEYIEELEVEIQQYRAIGTPDECRAAVEKQKAKTPIRNDKCTCPSCGTHNEVFKKRRNTVAHDIVYCWHCGQAVEIDRLEE
ncbi:MAG: hypothetical protein ACI4DL_01670 [Lachnospiraceae bacterium]